MELAFHSVLYPPSLSSTFTTRRPNFNSRLLILNKPFTVRNFSLPSALVRLTHSSFPPAYDSELETKKHLLLTSVQDTQRGLLTTPDQRSSIEEALVNVEGRNMGHPINLAKLDGTWRLQYTSAPDVLILLQAAATLPFFQVGQIFQKFECRDQSDGGIIRNVVRWSIPKLLEEQEGATLLVSAKFNVVSVRNIYLQFQEITVQDINISEELQAVIAPAILPRSFISLQDVDIITGNLCHKACSLLQSLVSYFMGMILQFLRTFKAQIPVRDPGRHVIRATLLKYCLVEGGYLFLPERNLSTDEHWEVLKTYTWTHLEREIDQSHIVQKEFWLLKKAIISSCCESCNLFTLHEMDSIILAKSDGEKTANGIGKKEMGTNMGTHSVHSLEFVVD
ncbi:hypothetical protein V8G54_004049 [Vigna mungo]|uniref:Plastid lipid-associated protein/fibrillin conserved domain-containing protein n=1 Tax=Vigna mungo TaxID=3915 RepID=A0AAQ3PFH8_VIGMU